MHESLNELLRLGASAQSDIANFELSYRARERELAAHLPALTELYDTILECGLQAVEHATADQLEALLRAVAFATMHGTMLQTNQQRIQMSLKTRLKRLEADRRPETEADEHAELSRIHAAMASVPGLLDELRDAAEYGQGHGTPLPAPLWDAFAREHGA